MTRRLAGAAALLVVIGLIGGALVVLSGLIPIKSDGHWPVTAWFLDFTKRRSVSTHSLGIDVPPLDSPSTILQGAAHYDFGCRPCHGSPLGPPPAITGRMTPHPPPLAGLVPRWDPEELFYLVKHGIKFTGMPGWTALQREDEVWAVVAFLRMLPRLDGKTYARLAASPAEEDPPSPGAYTSGRATGANVADELCARCHGPDGRGRTEPAFPRLAGQKSGYLVAALEAYADRTRHSGTMGPIAAGLDDATIAAVSSHFASFGSRKDQPEDSGETDADTRDAPAAESSAAARGRVIATGGIPAKDVPPCVECHASGDARHAAYPRLSGQFADYLVLQLRLFKEGRRGGAATAHVMQPIAARLTEGEMRDAAEYFAALTELAATEDVP